MYVRAKGGIAAHPILPVASLPVGFLTEVGTYEVFFNTGREPVPEDQVVLVNDEPCERFMCGGLTLFRFENAFVAGDLEIAVVRGGRVVSSASVEVEPEIAKLTRAEYAAMLEDIAAATLALYQISGTTVSAEIVASGQRSDVVTMDLIRSNIVAFERAALRIAESPIRVLRSVETRVDAINASHLDDRAIERGLLLGQARKATSAEARHFPALVRALGDRWLPHVYERRREEHLDTYENRAIVGFIRWLDGLLANMLRRLKAPPPFGCSLPPSTIVQADRITRWRGRLAVLSKKSLYQRLKPEYRLRPSHVFRMNPDYAAAFVAMTRMRAGLGTSSWRTPAVPLAKTYALYETWCQVQLLRAAAERFPGSRSAIGNMLRGCSRPGELGVRLLCGTENAIPLTDSLSLIYQRRFAPGHDARKGRTLMVEVVPDMTVERRDENGVLTGIVLVDPKYRTGASLLNGLRDLHVYRDAILGAGDLRLVRAAIALAPRCERTMLAQGGLPTGAPAVMLARPGHDHEVFDRLLQLAGNLLTPSQLLAAAA